MNKHKKNISSVYSSTIQHLSKIAGCSIEQATIIFLAGRQNGIEECKLINTEFKGFHIPDVGTLLSNQHAYSYIFENFKYPEES